MDGVKLKPRFHCAIPDCHGLLASGANLWEHVAEHNAQAALRRDAEARAAEAAARRQGGLVGLVTRNHQCERCGTRFPFAWQIRDGYCRECR